MDPILLRCRPGEERILGSARCPEGVDPGRIFLRPMLFVFLEKMRHGDGRIETGKGRRGCVAHPNARRHEDRE